MIWRRCIHSLVFFILVSATGCAVHDEGKVAGGSVASSGPASSKPTDVNLDVGHINNCVYEVIVPKPLDDTISYEKPLPMDLLPFQVRNDKYYSIGTAFASSSTEFTTAAHVMLLGFMSRCKEVLIRDIKGNVFNIDKIVKYSSRRDFVVFTVKGRQSPEYLETNHTPEIGEKVFAVGNALGQGVVIRDGLYTSTTPEEIDGKWNWIRFSAAASPGNSGGPLLDGSGKVAGVVLIKSPNENLNYALPISEVNRDYENNAEIFLKALFGLEIFDFVKSGVLDTKIKLPQSYSDLKQSCMTATYDYSSKMIKDLLAENQANTFPNGSGSDRLMYTHFSYHFPRLILRSEGGNWEAVAPKDIKNVNLENNGHISYGLLKLTTYAKLDKPDNMSVKDICFDSKVFMDLMLKAMNVTRPVGQEKVRITSLGKADNEYVHTDIYGRKWFAKTWPSFLGQEVAAFILPLPDGCAVIMKSGLNGTVLYDYVEDMKILTDFINVHYNGTFKQWREYIELKVSPPVISEIQLKLNNDMFSYKSKDFEVKCDCNNVKICDNSTLTVFCGYRRNKKYVTMVVSNIYLREDKFDKGGFYVDRLVKPPANDEKESDWWRKLVEGKKPFDRQIVVKDDSTTIRGVCKQPRETEEISDRAVMYSVRHVKNGTISQEEMESGLNRFIKNVQVYE